MTRPLRFGLFQFLDNGTSFQTNFPSASGRIAAMPGADGGFDVYGRSRAASDVGTVKFSLILKAQGPSEMQYKRDALAALAGSPRAVLLVQPTDLSKSKRWCVARCQSVQFSEDYRKRPASTQEATLTFSVADPRWYSKDAVYYSDDGNLMDTGLLIGGASSVALANKGTTSVTNNGSAPTTPLIRVQQSTAAWAAASIYPLELGDFVGTFTDSISAGFGLRQRDANGAVLGDWFWWHTLAAGEWLTVDYAAAKVTYEALTGSVTGYDDFYVIRGAPFTPLEPGTTTLELYGPFTGNLSVTVDYFDAWR